MRSVLLLTVAFFVAIVFADAARAGRYFAEITGVDAKKGTVDYKITFGKMRDNNVIARVAKDCVIREGYYRLGKPAQTKEGDAIANGLKNAIFLKASADTPVRVNIYTADENNAAKKIRKGDVIKILVNPKPKLN